MAACPQTNAGSDCRAVRLRTHELNLEPIIPAALPPAVVLIAQQQRSFVHIHNQDVDVSVVIKVSKGASATRMWRVSARAALGGDLFEASISQVAIYQSRSSIWILLEVFLDLGVDITCGHHDVRPPIVVK